jgi:hypothetical protein
MFITVVFSLAVCSAQAQEPKAKATKDDDTVVNEIRKGKEITVIRLKYANSQTTARTISDTFKQSVIHHVGQNRTVEDLSPIRVTADPNTNSLIVMASDADLIAVKKLVTEIDIESSTIRNPTSKTQVIKLKNNPDQALTDLLGLTRFTYAIDSARRQVIAIVDDTQLQYLSDLISRWDVAPVVAPPVSGGDVQVRVVWIANNDENADRPRTLPDDLKQLGPALKKIGLERPFAAATYVTTAMPNKQFSTVGAMFGPAGLMRITGQYDDRKSPPVLTISIREDAKEDRQIEISTEVSAPLGHLIVLGATRTLGGQQAFLVQVSRPDTTIPAGNP